MNELDRIAGGMPARTDAQKAVCVEQIEAFAARLIERGAFPGIVAGALAEVALRMKEGEAERSAFSP
jgi:hypothetical protein